MSYMFSVQESNFTMKKENLEGALEALKNLVKDKGDTLFCKNTKEVLYSLSLREALKEFDWILVMDWGETPQTFGNVLGIVFNDGSSGWLGSEDLIFAAIAPYVEQDSYIQCRGEDGTMWRYKFYNGIVEEISPQITW